MLRQYGANPCRGGNNPLRVGVLAVGSLLYLQDETFFRDRYGGRAVCRNPWQLLAFENGLLHAARRDPDTGYWKDSVWSGRSDMAVVRSLRDGRQRSVAVRLLILHDDLGLTKGTTAYPTLPDLRFYRCRSRRREPATALQHAA